MRIVALIILLAVPVAFAQTTSAPVRTTSDPDYARLVRSLAPPNPSMGRGGAATAHNDSYSSNVSPRPGPGSGKVKIGVARLATLCATIVLDREGYPLVYCTDTTSRHASLRLLDPDS